MKNGKLKGKNFFDVEKNSLITFHSSKAVQTGPDTIEFDGDFTIRGVTKQEKLNFTTTGKGRLWNNQKDNGLRQKAIRHE